MVHIFKSDVHLRKPLPLLGHSSTANEDPDDTNVALEDIDNAAEDLLLKLHNISETSVHANPVIFARSLPLLWKMLSNSQKKPSNLQQSTWKYVPKFCLILRHITYKKMKPIAVLGA